MYAPRVPNLTIYLPDDLAADVRAAELNVSRVCQVALRRKVRAAERAACDSTYRDRLGNVRADRAGRSPEPAA